MMSLAKPSAANRTIFARMTSRYGDVYLRALAVSSSRSILLNSMEYGLRRGIGTSRSGVCQTKRKSTLKIRHYIYEHEYLVLDEGFEVSTAQRTPQLPERLGLDLTNTLARQRETLGDLLQRVPARLAEAESETQDLLLPRAQRGQRALDVRRQVPVQERLSRRGGRRVFKKIS